MVVPVVVNVHLHVHVDGVHMLDVHVGEPVCLIVCMWIYLHVDEHICLHVH